MPQQKKSKFRRGFKKWTDEKVIELREVLDLKAYSPLCAFALCEHLEIPVFRPEEINGLSSEHCNILLGSGSNEWSAASIPIGKDKYIIIHNPKHSSARQQSNLMHELGHILCGHEIPESTKLLSLSGFLRNYNEDQEREAEWLGAALQLPRPALLWSLKKEMSIEEIATEFNASIQMVKYRINITGVKRQMKFITK